MLLRTRCGRRVRFRSSSVGTRHFSSALLSLGLSTSQWVVNTHEGRICVSLRGFGLSLLASARWLGLSLPSRCQRSCSAGCYPWNAVIIPKTAPGGAAKFWNAAKMATLPVNGLRGRGGGVSAACVSCCMVVVAPNDGRSEAQRPESRLAPESRFAGPA